MFRHVTWQRRRPTGHRPVPAQAIHRPQWTLVTDLTMRALRAWIHSSGHRCRLDGSVPCQAPLRLQDRVQSVCENRLTTAATVATGGKTIILLYCIGKNRSTRRELKYFGIGFQLILSQDKNKPEYPFVVIIVCPVKRQKLFNFKNFRAFNI